MKMHSFFVENTMQLSIVAPNGYISIRLALI